MRNELDRTGVGPVVIHTLGWEATAPPVTGIERPNVLEPIRTEVSIFPQVRRSRDESLLPGCSGCASSATLLSGTFLPATPSLKLARVPHAIRKPNLARGSPPARRKGSPQSSALRLCRPPLTLRPFRSAFGSSSRMGDTPPLAPCYPRLRQVAFGMYMPRSTRTCKSQNPKEKTP
jgi:hypothetical protein